MIKTTRLITALLPTVFLLFVAGCGNTAPLDNASPATDVPERFKTTVTTVATIANSTTTVFDTTQPPAQKIAFAIGEQVRVGYIMQEELPGKPSGRLNGWQILRNQDELDTANLAALKGHMNKNGVDVSAYTGDYFADKALLLLYFEMPSGSIRITVDALEVTGDALTVYYTSKCPSLFQTADMAYWCVLAEVATTDIVAVQKVIGEEQEVSVPTDVLAE